MSEASTSQAADRRPPRRAAPPSLPQHDIPGCCYRRVEIVQNKIRQHQGGLRERMRALEAQLGAARAADPPAGTTAPGATNHSRRQELTNRLRSSHTAHPILVEAHPGLGWGGDGGKRLATAGGPPADTARREAERHVRQHRERVRAQLEEAVRQLRGLEGEAAPQEAADPLVTELGASRNGDSREGRVAAHMSERPAPAEQLSQL